MVGQVVEISKFRFNTLRKYLSPVYTCLNNNIHASREQKQELLRTLIPQFFKRLREHRGISMERVASAADHTRDQVSAFENGEISASKGLELAYCRACSGTQEYHYFLQQIHEFMNPTAKESIHAIALDALKRFGIMIPTVDYRSLHSPRGVILEHPLADQ